MNVEDALILSKKYRKGLFGEPINKQRERQSGGSWDGYYDGYVQKDSETQYPDGTVYGSWRESDDTPGFSESDWGWYWRFPIQGYIYSGGKDCETTVYKWVKSD